MSNLTAMNEDSNSSRWGVVVQRYADRTPLQRALLVEAANDDSGPVWQPSPQATEGRRLGVQKMPVWLFIFGNRRLVCRRPVEVEISSDPESGVLVSCDRLHVYASGASYQEAVESLHEQVVHFYDEYTSLSEDDVIGQAVEIRRLYCEHFELSQNN